jgi:hypothetical protein
MSPHSGHLNFVLLFSAKHTCTKFSSLPNSRVCHIIHIIILVGSRMGPVSFVAWSEAKAFFLPFVLVSHHCQSDNFEPQDARMMKQLGMVSPEG